MTESKSYFPDRPQFSGFMRPCRVEGEVSGLEVLGQLPKEIDGVFYRVMPDPQLPPFIENDAVNATIDLTLGKNQETKWFDSGSTATATSAPFDSRTARHHFSSAM